MKFGLEFYSNFRKHLEEELKQNAIDYKRDIERYVKAKKHLSGTERSDATEQVSS